MYGFGVDDDVDESIQVVDRTRIAYFWSFDAQFFGLNMDAFTGRALSIDRLVGWTEAA